MTTIAEQLQEAADKATQASEQGNLWATGPINTTVPTDSGPVPTVAEFTRANQERADAAIEALGWVLAGDFTAGCTVTDRNQYVQVVGGPGYRWDGALPKVVAPGSSPTPIATGAWVLVGDMSLRGDLAAPSGAELLGIGGGRTQADKNAEWVSVTDAPYLVKFDNGVTDNTAGLNAAFQSGKCVFVPDPGAGNFAQVSDTVKIGDNTTIFFQNPSRPAIKAAASMSPNKHLVCTKNYAEGVLVANKGVHVFGINLDANGVARGGGPLTSGVGFVFNAVDSTVDLPTVANSPLWNYFFTSGNPFADVGHDGDNTAYSERLDVTRVTSIDPIGGDGAIIQGTKSSNFIGYRSVIGPSLAPSKVRKDSGFQVVEGCHDLVIDELEFFHNGALTTGFAVSSHVNKRYLSNIKVGSIYGKELSTLVGVFNDTSVQPIGGNDWLTRGLEIGSAHLDYPVLDAASTVMQSRLIDIQNMVEVKIGKCSARIKKADGSFSAPTCVVNFGGARSVTIDAIVVDGVPDVGTTSYPVSKTRGWVNVSDSLCDNIKLGGVNIENFGYLNRIVSDATNGAVTEIGYISASGVFTDGGTKEVVVSLSQQLSIGNASTPSGATLGRFSSAGIALAGKTLDVRQSAPETKVGGMVIRSITVGGAQVNAGVLFDRQFVSASDPTGTQGKGCVSFRTSAAAEGRFSITAFHEDVNEFRPIIAVRSTNSTKSLIPVIDNAVTFGEAANRPSQIFAVSGTINTCDGREKSDPLGITDTLLDVADEISINVWKWLDAIAKKGEGAARWHFGPIAQQVRDAFAKHGLDGCDYGLLCYDKWDDEFVDVVETVIGDDGAVLERKTGERIQTQWAGDRWGIRPDQCLWLKMAATERRANRAEERLSAIETRLAALETK